MFDIETKLGKIHFSQNIMNRIISNAVESCKGKVMLQNYRGGINAGSVEFIQHDDGYELKVYIVIRFGTSIKQMTSQIINNIYENTEKIIGQKPQKVTVMVTGVLSRNIARRNIEVSR